MFYDGIFIVSSQFQIRATDRGTPALSSDPVRIHIHVIDVNDNLPSFNSPEITFAVQENKINASVGTVMAIDPDSNSISCYKIKGEHLSFNLVMK